MSGAIPGRFGQQDAAPNAPSIYITDLAGPGDRKSIHSMTARSNAITYDHLHHLIGDSLWDSRTLEATLWRQADELVGGDGA